MKRLLFMKKLLNNSREFDEWMAENSRYDVLYNINEPRPSNYPCILFSYNVDDPGSIKNMTVYGFIYLSDFTNNN